ncbi:MAG: MBOAT family protein [Clostridia bacterium]|nr:MBOAT family protein [Clostridia bacterium]
MLFSSLIFLVCFLPLVLFFYYVVCRKSRSLQNIFLLIASLGFYAWGEPWFVLVMILSICGNFVFGLLVDRFRGQAAKAKGIIALSLVFNLSIIFIFKYLMFTLENINTLFGTDLSVGEIALPIGISFFTFQAISYVIDIYRGRGQVQKNVLNVGLYISFFPQLIAGPIVRYETISDQIRNRTESFDKFSAGVCRFLVGLAKKVLLANNFAVVADKAFAVATTDYCSSGFAWMGAIAYTLQIYYDFSGYSDMAIGLGKMFGFNFNENFNYPYISKSVSEFWRRWHISLGSWFRDYVYFPLGGSRVESKGRLVFNLLVVWFLTGLWHGANWTFIFWGLMYFVLISLEKVTGYDKRLKQIDDEPSKSRFSLTVFGHIYTMLLVIIGWVFFRADSITDALVYVSTMFGNSDVAFFDKYFIGFGRENIFYFIFGILFSAPIAKKIRALADSRFSEHNPAVCILYAAVLIGGMIFAMAYLIKGAYNPFIYFNF